MCQTEQTQIQHHHLNGRFTANVLCVCVCVFVCSGMEESHCERTEYLSSYGLDVDAITLIPGSSARIGPKNANTACEHTHTLISVKLLIKTIGSP